MRTAEQIDRTERRSRLADILDEIVTLEKIRSDLLAEAVKLSGRKPGDTIINEDGKPATIKVVEADVQLVSLMTKPRHILTLALTIMRMSAHGGNRRLKMREDLAEQWASMPKVVTPPIVQTPHPANWGRRKSDKV